jgi:hypothetical protein
LAHVLARERKRADAAAADDVQDHTVPADHDDEVGQGCAQGFGHAHFTPEIEGKFFDPGPVFGDVLPLAALYGRLGIAP